MYQKHVLMLKKTRHSMITMKSQRCPPVSTGNVEMFFFPSNFFFFFFFFFFGERGRFDCSSISIGRFFCTSSLSASSHATIVLLSFLFFFFFVNESSKKAEKKSESIGAFVVPRPTWQEIKIKIIIPKKKKKPLSSL